MNKSGMSCQIKALHLVARRQGHVLGLERHSVFPFYPLMLLMLLYSATFSQQSGNQFLPDFLFEQNLVGRPRIDLKKDRPKRETGICWQLVRVLNSTHAKHSIKFSRRRNIWRDSRRTSYFPHFVDIIQSVKQLWKDSQIKDETHSKWSLKVGEFRTWLALTKFWFLDRNV